MRKRVIPGLAVVLLLAGFSIVVWTLAGLPPVRMVWRYGFSYHPEPTGQVRSIRGIEFVEIGPGCFRMGSEHRAEGGDLPGRWCARLGLPWGDQPKPSEEMPVHWVEFPQGFWISRMELTNRQFEQFRPVGNGRSYFSSGDHQPVLKKSWETAKEYCNWLSELSGVPIRLPSEAEWECACRAGSTTEYCFGDDEKRLGEYAWYQANSENRTHEVGTRTANAWGLFDFHGNAWEYCEDRYFENYAGAPADGSAWKEGATEPSPRTPEIVVRGGSYFKDAKWCRSARRGGTGSLRGSGAVGIRLAFTLPAESE